jgi:hypothetical protein
MKLHFCMFNDSVRWNMHPSTVVRSTHRWHHGWKRHLCKRSNTPHTQTHPQTHTKTHTTHTNTRSYTHSNTHNTLTHARKTLSDIQSVCVRVSRRIRFLLAVCVFIFHMWFKHFQTGGFSRKQQFLTDCHGKKCTN